MTDNVRATAPTKDFSECFDVAFRKDEFDTIGGVALIAFGHVPERGELVDVEGMPRGVVRGLPPAAVAARIRGAVTG